MAVEKHWVEELFPPTYGLDEQGIRLTPPSSLPFCHWLQDWLPFPRTRRAKLITEEETDERTTEIINEAEQENGKTIEVVLSVAESIEAVDTSTASVPSTAEGSSHVSSVKESVWTWAELCALREHYQSVQSDKIRLKVEVADMSQHLDMARKKLSEVFHVAERQFTLIQKLRRENEQLSLKLSQLHAENEQVIQQKQEVDVDRRRLAVSLQRMEEKFSGLELTVKEKDQQIADLDIIIQRQKTSKVVAVEAATISLKVKHEKEMKRLSEEVEEMRLKLKRCQETHQRDKRALDQLRKHFAANISGHVCVDCLSFEYNS